LLTPVRYPLTAAEGTMNDDMLLTLHCPQCRQITDVV